MSSVSELRSPYTTVGRIVYFGRMLDKIRQHAAGQLPEAYIPNLGDARWGVFDARCCRLLGVSFADLSAQVLAGGSDEAVLQWAETNGTPLSDEDCEIWNGFMTKRGWRDDLAPVLAQRISESGFQDKPIATMFDYIDFDEGRDPADFR